MKKIIIAGPSTYGVKNHGDDAMLKVFCDGLRQKMPNIKITLLARHPDKNFDKQFGITSIKNLDHDSKKQSTGRWFLGFNHNDSANNLEDIRKSIEECDALVIGGNAFMEVSKSEFLKGITTYAGLLGILAKLFQKPFFLFGTAVYPIESDYTKQIARFLCNNAALVALREQDSREELLKAEVENSPKIKVYADPAWGLEPIKDKTLGIKILKKEGIDLKTQKLIGVVFRHMYWLWNDKQFEKYANQIAHICDNLITQFKTDLILFPNCTYNIDNPFEDDRKIQEIIYAKIKNKNLVHRIKHEYTLQETLSLYPLLDFLISNRRHSLIFGAIHHVPIFALSTGHPWHFKPWIKELSLSSQLASLTDDTISEIETRIIESFNRSDKIKKTISKTVPRLRERALRGIDEISKIILK